MALFGLKKEEKKGDEGQGSRGGISTSGNVGSGTVNLGIVTRDLSGVLIAPRLTEKSASRNDAGVYTFIVRRDATKYDVRDAIRALFGVTPRKVTMVNRPPRTTRSRARGRAVTVPGMKKANVFLKKGDRLDLI